MPCLKSPLPPEGVKKLGDGAQTGEYLQKCRMRVFNLMVLNAFKLSILHGLSVFVSEVPRSRAAGHLILQKTFLPLDGGGLRWG